jgi:hypothetical protein
MSIYTTIEGYNVPKFEIFRKQNTNGVGKKERKYIEIYGDIPFERAYEVYVSEIITYKKRIEKIQKFEDFLIVNKINKVESNISESRYYNYNGMKYRFSSHIYPTGSMTNNNCIDFCADPHLIDNALF